MLQKIYWLGQFTNADIEITQEFRTIFCKHEFPRLLFSSRAFVMVGGGLISNTYAWTLAINNVGKKVAGYSYPPVDEVSEQIRRLLILRLNFFFGTSPEEVEKHCNTEKTVASELLVRQILPDFFSSDYKNLYKEIEDLQPWIQKILHFPRPMFDKLFKALTAYERSYQVLSVDPGLSYSLLIFAVEALANNHSDYNPTWNDVRGNPRKILDSLFQDGRISDVEESWIEELRQALVDTIHPGATRRFTKFAIDHIPPEFFDALPNNSKSPLRKSRINQAVQNAYTLRSSFAHALKPLNQLLISESYRAEEVEQDNEIFITLRGLFRLVRFILLNFIEQQKFIKEESEIKQNLDGWINKDGSGTVQRLPPAYMRMKSKDGQLYDIDSQYAKNWFEDILRIYQENYIECLHQNESERKSMFIGIATLGSSHAGLGLFRFDPNPNYDWISLKNQSLDLIPITEKKKKGYLQGIALLCCHLEEMHGEDGSWNNTLKSNKFGDSIQGIERLVVDVIHNDVKSWSGEQSEKVMEKHIKKAKFSLPSRVEIACMLQVAKLFQDEESVEGRTKWLNIAYGDTASYPQIQNLIKSWLHSENEVIEPQVILTISKEDDPN